MWHPCYKPGNKSWMRKRPDWDYDNTRGHLWHIHCEYWSHTNLSNNKKIYLQKKIRLLLIWWTTSVLHDLFWRLHLYPFRKCQNEPTVLKSDELYTSTSYFQRRCPIYNGLPIYSTHTTVVLTKGTAERLLTDVLSSLNDWCIMI